MPLMDLGGLSLWFDIIAGPQASATAIPVVMVQGLGMQAVEWPASLIERLATGRRVIIFDNRDAGLSQPFGPSVDPALRPDDFPGHQALAAPPPYTLDDMSDDALRLADALNIQRFHLIGFSMGGMIAQMTAAKAPDRITTLVGLMTSAGQTWLDSTAVADRMMRRSIVFEPDETCLIDQILAAEDIYAGGSALPPISQRMAAAKQSIARAYMPVAIWRQACAMRGTGDRTAILRGIQAPTLMLHGEDDPVISLQQAAVATTLIPRVAFAVLRKTGHVLTEQIGADIACAIEKFWRDLL